MPDRQQGTITATATEIEMAATAAVVAAAITTIIITVTVTVIVKRRGPSFSLSNVLFSSSSYLYLATCNWQLATRESGAAAFAASLLLCCEPNFDCSRRWARCLGQLS